MTETVVTITAAGAYHSVTDINNVFGADNVLKWADLDNDRDSAKISARVQFVINSTEAHVNSLFRRSRYTIPFVVPIPFEILEICCYMSGAKLYEPRQTDDITAEGVAPMKTLVMQKRRQAEDMARRILANKIVLDVPEGGDSGDECPAWVSTDVLHMRDIPADQVTLYPDTHTL